MFIKSGNEINAKYDNFAQGTKKQLPCACGTHYLQLFIKENY